MHRSYVQSRGGNRATFTMAQIVTFAGILLAGVHPATARGRPAPVKEAGIPITPPMGWNSYNSFGDSVTESEVMANAEYMRAHLLEFGWSYVVIDYRWYDPGARGRRVHSREGARLAADNSGRFLPAPNRFPSAAGGQGFKPLADKLHAMGLKFGLHVMRGIPRQAVLCDAPIEGSEYRASAAADTDSTCDWCPDMYGVKADQPAGQAWYNALMRQYAAWGVDFIKVDDLTKPYASLDVVAIRRAINHCGRPMIFSASPGPTPLRRARHIEEEADMWRISQDVWDNWKRVNTQFELLAKWQKRTCAGRWPDPDMLPIGLLSKWVNHSSDGDGRLTHLTRDEQLTLMSLWSMAPAPLMVGADLPENDAWTQSLLTNAEVLSINQDALARPARRVIKGKYTEIWVKELADGSRAVGLFNRGNDATKITVPWDRLGLNGQIEVRDTWRHMDVPDYGKPLNIARHGCVLLRVLSLPSNVPSTAFGMSPTLTASAQTSRVATP